MVCLSTDKSSSTDNKNSHCSVELDETSCSFDNNEEIIHEVLESSLLVKTKTKKPTAAAIQRSVQFGQVSIREYSITVGIAPDTTMMAVHNNNNNNNTTNQKNNKNNNNKKSKINKRINKIMMMRECPMELDWEHTDDDISMSVYDYETLYIQCRNENRKHGWWNSTPTDDVATHGRSKIRVPYLRPDERRQRIALVQGIGLDTVKAMEIQRCMELQIQKEKEEELRKKLNAQEEHNDDDQTTTPQTLGTTTIFSSIALSIWKVVVKQ